MLCKPAENPAGHDPVFFSQASSIAFCADGCAIVVVKGHLVLYALHQHQLVEL